MDSPESSKIIAPPSSASASPAPQESPFLSYLRSLSPIHPPKVARITRGFSDLNIPTPPPVFTSPRLNPQSETIFLKRSLHPHLSSSELSRENDDRSNAYTEGSDVSELPVKNLIDSLDSSPQKGCDNKDSMLVQPSSPLACFDEYLANPVEVNGANSFEVNGANSSGSDDICMKQNKDAGKSSGSHCTRLSEATLTLDDAAHQVMKDMESQMAAKRTPLNLADEKLQEKPVLVVKSVNKNDDQVQSGVISDQINDTVVSGSSLEPTSGAKNCQHLENEGAYQQSAEGGQNGERSYKPPVLHPIEACQNRDEHSLMVFQGSVENRECNLEEAGQSQRGARRRCLQFEAAEARRKSTGKSHCISNPANLVPLSRLPPIQTEMGLSDSSHLDLATKDCNPVINSSQAMVSKLDFCSVQSLEAHASKIDGSVRNRESTPRKAPLSSGIGLHLNSIVNAAAMGSSVALSTNSTEKDCPVAQREKSPAQLEQHLVDESKSSSLPRSISTCGSGDQKEIQATVTESSAVFQCPCEKVDRCEEFNPPSPKKNRKRPFHTGENEGCKRCNCRRSKCLKLYCECFAAGIYCAEPCACQECFNKPEYEDTVLETRQQIESRNPLAFAPKVVRRVSGSPANSVDDKNRVTPSSARHKRGCNCKKSMCLKKYCECYQAGVGCSDGCRCEGCKNIFGAKEGYGELREMVYKRVDDRSCEDLSDRKQVEEARRDLVQSEHCHPHNLTPVTPLFQRSHHGKGVSKSRFPAPSPESDTNTSSYVKSLTSSRCLDIHDSRAKMSEGNLDLVFYDQELELSATGKVGQFSPRWDGLENLCDLTPLPKPPSRVTNVSTSSNTTDCTKVSRVQLQGSNRLSGSLRWRSSPITPMSQLGGNKFYQGPSGSGYDIVGDDTPDILKDAQTPIQAVKASSPNQKRVSPPHAQQNSLRLSASPGLKSGRKFVLQSISSFPPLTPISDPKASSIDE